MLELHISDTNITTGTVSVGWCVSQDTLDFLAEKGIKNPAIVFVVSKAVPKSDEVETAYHSISNEYRTAVPLKDLICYLEFKSPGINYIRAFIAYNMAYAHDQFVIGRARLLNYEGDNFIDSANIKPLNDVYSHVKQNEFNDFLMAEPLVVDVPESCFAKQPSAWEKTWVEWIFSKRVDNQCGYRRKRLFAYTIQPFLFVVIMLLRLIAVIAALLTGMRGLTVKHLIYPFRYDANEYMIQLFENGSIFLDKEIPKTKLQFIFQILKMTCMPIFLIPLSAMFICLFMAAAEAFGLMGVLLTLGIIVLSLTIGTVIAYVIYHRVKANKAKEDAEAWYLNQEELKLITCNSNGKKATTFADLPAHKKTIKLRFLDLKSKVCRPYAK